MPGGSISGYAKVNKRKEMVQPLNSFRLKAKLQVRSSRPPAPCTTGGSSGKRGGGRGITRNPASPRIMATGQRSQIRKPGRILEWVV